MLKIAALVVALAVVALLVYVATRPDSFRIERSARIQAPPEKIYAYIQDFHEWVTWSPWENVDPAMTRTYSGAASGKGAVYEWAGNRDIGQGRMEITDATRPSRVLIDLHFVAPFEARNVADFTLVPEGASTRVTWAMYGPNRFLSKLMGLFLNMDKMIGGQFETGLANLKATAEK